VNYKVLKPPYGWEMGHGKPANKMLDLFLSKIPGGCWRFFLSKNLRRVLDKAL
jgi:hypothetical protein